jgi:hypothetical protein
MSIYLTYENLLEMSEATGYYCAPPITKNKFEALHKNGICIDDKEILRTSLIMTTCSGGLTYNNLVGILAYIDADLNEFYRNTIWTYAPGKELDNNIDLFLSLLGNWRGMRKLSLVDKIIKATRM